MASSAPSVPMVIGLPEPVREKYEAILAKRTLKVSLALAGPYELDVYKDVTVRRRDAQGKMTPHTFQLFLAGESHLLLENKRAGCKRIAQSDVDVIDFTDLLLAEATSPGATCVDFVWEAGRQARDVETVDEVAQLHKFNVQKEKSAWSHFELMESVFGRDRPTRQTWGRLGNMRVHRGDLRTGHSALYWIDGIYTRLTDYGSSIKHGTKPTSDPPTDKQCAVLRCVQAMDAIDPFYLHKQLECLSGLTLSPLAWTPEAIDDLVQETQLPRDAVLRDGKPRIQLYMTYGLAPLMEERLGEGPFQNVAALREWRRIYSQVLEEGAQTNRNGGKETVSDKLLYKRSGRHRTLAQLDDIAESQRRPLVDAFTATIRDGCTVALDMLRSLTASPTAAELRTLTHTFLHCFARYADVYILGRALRTTTAVSVIYYGSAHTQNMKYVLLDALDKRPVLSVGSSDRSCLFEPVLKKSLPWTGWRRWWNALHAAVHRAHPVACSLRLDAADADTATAQDEWSKKEKEKQEEKERKEKEKQEEKEQKKREKQEKKEKREQEKMSKEKKETEEKQQEEKKEDNTTTEPMGAKGEEDFTKEKTFTENSALQRTEKPSPLTGAVRTLYNCLL